jgi:hypothetical protein
LNAEGRPRGLLLLLNGETPVRVIIVEVQLEKSERKRFIWPAYLAVSRAVHGCPADRLIMALLTVLRVRGIAVPDATRERVVAQKDAERLERWHERAILATSLAEVLDDPS